MNATVPLIISPATQSSGGFQRDQGVPQPQKEAGKNLNGWPQGRMSILDKIHWIWLRERRSQISDLSVGLAFPPEHPKLELFSQQPLGNWACLVMPVSLKLLMGSSQALSHHSGSSRNFMLRFQAFKKTKQCPCLQFYCLLTTPTGYQAQKETVLER